MKIIEDKTAKVEKKLNRWANEYLGSLLVAKIKCPCGLKFTPESEDIYWEGDTAKVRCQCGKIHNAGYWYAWTLGATFEWCDKVYARAREIWEKERV